MAQPADVKKVLGTYRTDDVNAYIDKRKLVIPLVWLDAASRLNAAAFRVAIIVGHLGAYAGGFHDKDERDPKPNLLHHGFSATASDLALLNTSTKVVRQGLAALKKAGLIHIEERPGRPSVIKLLMQPPHLRKLARAYIEHHGLGAGHERDRERTESIASRIAWTPRADGKRLVLRLPPVPVLAKHVVAFAKDHPLYAVRQFWRFLRTEQGQREIESNAFLRKVLTPSVFKEHREERRREKERRATDSALPDEKDQREHLIHALKRIGFYKTPARPGATMPTFVHDVGIKVIPTRVGENEVRLTMIGVDVDAFAPTVVAACGFDVVVQRPLAPEKRRCWVHIPTWEDFDCLTKALGRYVTMTKPRRRLAKAN